MVILQDCLPSLPRGVAKIWQGGQELFFPDLEIRCALLRDVPCQGGSGHAPPTIFFKWCVLVYILMRFCR